VPSFLSDILDAFYTLRAEVVADWEGIPIATRILIAIVTAALAIYAGSKAEHGGWSGLLFFAAFGIFAYVMVAGYSMFQ
jgi:hypothetical protein